MSGKWVEVKGLLPASVARAWFAVERGRVYCGIFQVIPGNQFILAYHRIGDIKATTEKHSSFELAQFRANRLLGTVAMIGRKWREQPMNEGMLS